MPGAGRAEVGNLSLNPDVAVFALHMRANRRDQVAHAPHPAVDRAEAETELVGGTHGNRSVLVPSAEYLVPSKADSSPSTSLRVEMTSIWVNDETLSAGCLVLPASVSIFRRPTGPG